jgi:hypothetical protein
MLIIDPAMQVGKLRKGTQELSLVEYVTARVITSGGIRTAIMTFQLCSCCGKESTKRL